MEVTTVDRKIINNTVTTYMLNNFYGLDGHKLHNKVEREDSSKDIFDSINGNHSHHLQQVPVKHGLKLRILIY